MKRILILIIIILITGVRISAQTDMLNRPKIYDAWIKSEIKAQSYAGVLYEIKDSSVVFSDSRVRQNYQTGNLKFMDIPFRNLDYIKTRKLNSIKTGVIVGSLAGLCSGLLVVNSEKETFGEWAPLYYIIMGTTGSGFGAAIGFLAGSVKFTIPINRNLNDLNSNRGLLQKYSYANEYPAAAINPGVGTQHKSYIAILEGPSFPLGDFKKDFRGSSISSIGYFANIPDIGLRINEKLGISGLAFNSQFNMERNDSSLWWDYTGFMAGPLFSIPAGSKFRFDIKPLIGSVSSQYSLNQDVLENGKGFGTFLSVSLLYNFSRRWCAILKPGYFNTNQKFRDGSKKYASIINLNIGIGYRFR